MFFMSIGNAFHNLLPLYLIDFFLSRSEQYEYESHVFCLVLVRSPGCATSPVDIRSVTVASQTGVISSVCSLSFVFVVVDHRHFSVARSLRTVSTSDQRIRKLTLRYRSAIRHAFSDCNSALLDTKQVCPRSCGKSAALLLQIATPRARPKPARLARCLLYTSPSPRDS